MDGFQRRFGGVGRLVSAAGLERLRRAHVCVIGLGGVGSWAVEALARSGVGELTLVDLDDVCISNVNRQLHAVQGELGKPKVEAMKRRVGAIHPECKVNDRQSFFLKSNVDDILGQGFGYVVDAIDSPSLKALLIAECRKRNIPVITTGGAGGRTDPTQLRLTDLAYTSGDRLLRYVRSILRKNYGFPRGDRPFGVECVYSAEKVVYPADTRAACESRVASPDLRLDCETGFGTACFVTGAFGFAAASRVVAALAKDAAAKLPAVQAPHEVSKAPNNLLKFASTVSASADISIPSNSEAKL